MQRKLNISDKLEFENIDMTAAEIVIQEILDELPQETAGIIFGRIETYDGPVTSYIKRGMTFDLSSVLGTEDKTIDIQTHLGEMGQEMHKFECYIYTPEYENYKYRIFFAKYGVANYPVDIILDESVAESISAARGAYVRVCNTREDIENLIYNIFSSKKIISVMQTLIRINQSKINKTHCEEEN